MKPHRLAVKLYRPVKNSFSRLQNVTNKSLNKSKKIKYKFKILLLFNNSKTFNHWSMPSGSCSQYLHPASEEVTE